MIESLHRLSPCAALCTILALAATAVQAQNTTYQFDLPAQPLADALRAVGRQASRNILFDPALVEGISVPALRAELTVSDAVSQLLTGTKLSTQEIAPDTVLIQSSTRDTAKKPVASKTTVVEGTNGYTRLAQAETVASQASSDVAAGTSEPLSERRIELEEIIVTGTNIRGVYPSSSPVEIYTAEDIARSGATTTEQFIQKLPQNLGTRAQYSPAAQPVPNREGVNSIDLRGLGVGTTLVLLNGRRLALASNGQAADVSLIPASAIQRVEMLTDGASAIYGSDAIGGVVNFVLRDDFAGAETRVSYGTVTSGGLHQSNATQTFGHRWTSGHGLISYDYFSASALENADRAYAVATGPGYLSPVDRRHNAFATVAQTLGDNVSLSGDFAYSLRDTRNFSTDLTNADSLNHFNTAYRSETEQSFANLGADIAMGTSLNGSIRASYSKIDVDTGSFTDNFNRGTTSTGVQDTNYSAIDLTAMLSGSLLQLPAGSLRFSFGADYLDEEYLAARQIGGALSGRNLGRATTSLFGEVFIPLIGEEQSMPLARRLELSVAARYTGYDDRSSPALNREFGESTSPKIGLLWAPVDVLHLRATYGESFRAPTLTEIDPSGARNILLQPFPIAGVNSTVLFVAGPDVDLASEKAETFTLGFDVRPAARPRFHLSATYFNIDYVDRIAVPNALPARINPAAWPDLVYRPVSVAQIERLLGFAPVTVNNTGINVGDPQTASAQLFALANFWIEDDRTRNLALTKLDGLDLGMGDRFDTAWGDVDVGAQLTKIFDYREQASSTAPVTRVVDTVLRPVDFRARMQIGLTRGGLQSTVNINYVDDYTNPLAGGAQRIDSWTTLDWALSYEFGRDAGSTFLSGLRLSLSAQNLLDSEPPFVASNNNVASRLNNSAGFDPANANPLGRFVVVGIAKTW